MVDRTIRFTGNTMCNNLFLEDVMWFVFYASSPQTRLKATHDEGLQEEKH